jgi:hypothetical protein
MRKKINPMVAVIVVIVAIIGLGLAGMAVMNRPAPEAKVILNPAKPEQTKPDAKLGVDNSGT